MNDFDYVGGGYWRRQGVRIGDKAELLHGDAAIDYAVKRSALAIRMLQWAEAKGTATPSSIVLARAAIRLLDPQAALSDYKPCKDWSAPEPVLALLTEAGFTSSP